MKRVALLLWCVTITACNSVPEPIIQMPKTMAPAAAKPQRELNGSIYQVSSYRPLFEDVRARGVGDVLTINITESTTAGKSDASSAAKTGSTSFAAPQILGIPATTTAKLGVSTSASNSFADKGAQTNSNTFTGTIGVTVIDVLPNGNLVVSGEKQLGFDTSAEYVRFSGVVRPDTIASGNQVASTQVADAKFEYRSTVKVDKAEVNSMLNRFFLSFIPL